MEGVIENAEIGILSSVWFSYRRMRLNTKGLQLGDSGESLGI